MRDSLTTTATTTLSVAAAAATEQPQWQQGCMLRLSFLFVLSDERI